jgi:hypothetical protein
VTDARHRDRTSEQRGRAATRATPEVVAILVTLAVGIAWYLAAANGPDGWLRYDLLFILTLGVAIAFGASMSIVRGFVMSTVLAAAAIVGRGLGEGDVISLAIGRDWLGGDGTVDPVEMMAFWLVEVLGTAIFVLSFWLVGFVIGLAWRRVARR